jgi:hypothetical protein
MVKLMTSFADVNGLFCKNAEKEPQTKARKITLAEEGKDG